MDDSQDRLYAFTVPGVALLCIISGMIGDGFAWLDPHMMALPNQFWFIPEWSMWFYKVPSLIIVIAGAIAYCAAVIGLIYLFLKVVASNNFFWGVLKFYMYLFMVFAVIYAIAYLFGAARGK